MEKNNKYIIHLRLLGYPADFTNNAFEMAVHSHGEPVKSSAISFVFGKRPLISWVMCQPKNISEIIIKKNKKQNKKSNWVVIFQLKVKPKMSSRNIFNHLVDFLQTQNLLKKTESDLLEEIQEKINKLEEEILEEEIKKI